MSECLLPTPEVAMAWVGHSVVCVCYGYCMPDLPTFEELCDTTDYQLFNKTVSNPCHTLHTLLPPPSTASQHYNLRRRTHMHSLPEHDTHLSDCNFLTRMYKDTY